MGRGAWDLTGKRFGSLVAVGRWSAPAGAPSRWLCKCDCGRTAVVPGSALRSGRAERCGTSCPLVTGIAPGRRFGMLEVVGLSSGSRRVSHEMWACRCDCGTACEVSAKSLLNGDRTTCGRTECGNRMRSEALGRRDGTTVAMLNSKATKRSSTGVRGVHRHDKGPCAGMYTASISLSGHLYPLGSYTDMGRAAEARRIAERVLWDPVKAGAPVDRARASEELMAALEDVRRREAEARAAAGGAKGAEG